MTWWRAFVFFAVLALSATIPSHADEKTQGSARESLEKLGIAFTAERLVQFAAQGDTMVVERFFTAGMPINTADPVRGATALHNAAAQGHVALTRRLIESGADVNAQDWRGATPLINAAFSGHVEIVQMLLAAKADPNHKPKVAPTALVAAVQSGKTGVVETLIKAGANPSQKGPNKMTPLRASGLAGRAEIEKILIAAGAKK